MHGFDAIDLGFTGNHMLRDSVSLAARASFVGDISRGANGEPGTLDLVSPMKGSWSTIGARVEQHDGRVRATVSANPDRAVTGAIRNKL